MRIRPAVDGEDLELVQEANSYWIGSTVYWQMMDATRERHPAPSWMAETSDGEPLAHATLICEAIKRADQALGFLWVAPASRRRGVGTALHELILRTASDHGFRRVLMAAQNAEPGSIDAARAWGGEEDGYHHEQRLDLTALTDPQISGWCERATADGVSLHQVDDPEELASLYPFCRDRFDEAPDVGDESEPLSEAMFLVIAKPGRTVVARRGSEVVGLTCVSPRRGSVPSANVEFTGVHPDHRGRGIALALKAEQARRLRDNGIAQLFTQNLDGNGPILAVNTRMGFVREPGRTDFSFSVPD